MREMPILGMCCTLARQVGSDAPRAPQMRIIETSFPSQRGCAESDHIGMQVADLLRMAVGASFAAINDAPALLAHGQAQRMLRRHAAHLVFEDASRPDTEQSDRHRKNCK